MRRKGWRTTQGESPCRSSSVVRIVLERGFSGYKVTHSGVGEGLGGGGVKGGERKEGAAGEGGRMEEGGGICLFSDFRIGSGGGSMQG